MIAHIMSILLYIWLAFSIARGIYNRAKYPGYNSTAEMRERVMDLENKLGQQRELMFVLLEDNRGLKDDKEKMTEYLKRHNQD